MNEPKGAVLVDLMGALKRSLNAKPTFSCGCPKDQVGGRNERQSEPPIADGVGVGIANLFMGHEAETAGKVLARAYLSLKAERDALRAENAAKYEEIASERHSYILLEAERQRLYDENAALKARVEELSESLLWATSSYEERVVILANREKRKEQEASNDK